MTATTAHADRYLAAWNETDPEARRAAVEVCHAELVWAGHPVDVRVWLDEQDDTTPGDNS